MVTRQKNKLNCYCKNLAPRQGRKYSSQWFESRWHYKNQRRRKSSSRLHPFANWKAWW